MVRHRFDGTRGALGGSGALLSLLLLIYSRSDPLGDRSPSAASAPPPPRAPRRKLFGVSTLDPRTVESKTNSKSKPPASQFPPPAGLRLLLVGDSTMHGEYLSLTHYLRHGEWKDRPVFGEGEGHAGGIEAYYAETTKSLFPHEVCDCAESNSTTGLTRAFRVYRDPARDNAVAYLPVHTDDGSSGPPFRARLWPCLSLQALERGDGPGLTAYLEREAADPRRRRNYLAKNGKEWAQAVSFVSHHMFIDKKRKLRPTHVVMGAGPHGGGLCGTQGGAERKRLVDAVRGAGMVPVWQTAPSLPPSISAVGGGRGCGKEVDFEMCGVDGVLCVRADAVFANSGPMVQPEDGGHWDERMPHFEHPRYRALGEHLLEQIRMTLPDPSTQT